MGVSSLLLVEWERAKATLEKGFLSILALSSSVQNDGCTAGDLSSDRRWRGNVLLSGVVLHLRTLILPRKSQVRCNPISPPSLSEETGRGSLKRTRDSSRWPTMRTGQPPTAEVRTILPSGGLTNLTPLTTSVPPSHPDPSRGQTDA